MAGLTGGIQEWRRNLNDEDRVTIQRELVRLQVKTLAQPNSGRFINCKNAAGRTVLKIYPDRIAFAPGCAETEKMATEGLALSAFAVKEREKAAKVAARPKTKAALEIQVESPGVCQTCFLQLPVNGRCASDE